MSKLGFFLRFTLTYALSMAVLGVAVSFLGTSAGSSLNTPILMGVAYWCFYSFSMKNGRVVRNSEKWDLILLALAGDVLASLVLGIPTMLVEQAPLRFLFIGVAIIAPMHFLLLILCHYLVKKQLIKQHPEWVPS